MKEDSVSQDISLALSSAPKINQVKITACLGSGGMAVVYKGVQAVLNREVAVKVLLKTAISGENSIMRFQNEAKLSGSLDHPNIAKTFGFGISNDGRPYLLMEFIEGKSLSDEIEENAPMKFGRFRQIFVPLLFALGHAHAAGLLHRDIKPANIMLCKSADGAETVKLLDFGIAKLLLDDPANAQSFTRTGAVIGSPAYMSPEQCEAKELDQRSDIYSIACVMFQSLCNELPFSGETSLEIMHQHVSGKLPSAAELSGYLEIPQSLSKLILRALDKDPARRPQSADEFANELNRIIEEITLERSPRKRVDSGWKGTKKILTILLACAIANPLILFALSVYRTKLKEQVKTIVVADSVRLNKLQQKDIQRLKRNTSRLRMRADASSGLALNDAQNRLELCKSLCALGCAEMKNSNYEDAESSFSEAANMLDQKMRLDNKSLLSEKLNLLTLKARNYSRAGKLLDARIDMGRALKLAGQIWGPASIEWQKLRCWNVVLTIREKRFEQAEKCLAEIRSNWQVQTGLAKIEAIQSSEGESLLDLLDEVFLALQAEDVSGAKDNKAKIRSFMLVGSMFRDFSDFRRDNTCLNLGMNLAKQKHVDDPELLSALKEALSKHHTK